VLTPNLDDPEQRRAYRRELRGVARLLRWTGLALVLLGTAGLLIGGPQDWWTGPSWFSLAIGAALTLAGVVQRTRYHRRRMRGIG